MKHLFALLLLPVCALAYNPGPPTNNSATPGPPGQAYVISITGTSAANGTITFTGSGFSQGGTGGRTFTFSPSASNGINAVVNTTNPAGVASLVTNTLFIGTNGVGGGSGTFTNVTIGTNVMTAQAIIQAQSNIVVSAAGGTNYFALAGTLSGDLTFSGAINANDNIEIANTKHLRFQDGGGTNTVHLAATAGRLIVSGAVDIVTEQGVPATINGAAIATGTPLYVQSETNASSRLASNVWAAADSTTNYVRRTGGSYTASFTNAFIFSGGSSTNGDGSENNGATLKLNNATNDTLAGGSVHLRGGDGNETGGDVVIEAPEGTAINGKIYLYGDTVMSRGQFVGNGSGITNLNLSADTNFVRRIGGGMSGGLTNTSAEGFVGNGAGLTNIQNVALLNTNNTFVGGTTQRFDIAIGSNMTIRGRNNPQLSALDDASGRGLVVRLTNWAGAGNPVYALDLDSPSVYPYARFSAAGTPQLYWLATATHPAFGVDPMDAAATHARHNSGSKYSQPTVNFQWYVPNTTVGELHVLVYSNSNIYGRKALSISMGATPSALTTNYAGEALNTYSHGAVYVNGGGATGNRNIPFFVQSSTNVGYNAFYVSPWNGSTHRARAPRLVVTTNQFNVTYTNNFGFAARVLVNLSLTNTLTDSAMVSLQVTGGRVWSTATCPSSGTVATNETFIQGIVNSEDTWCITNRSTGSAGAGILSTIIVND